MTLVTLFINMLSPVPVIMYALAMVCDTILIVTYMILKATGHAI